MDINRYKRNIMLPQIGEEGQKALANARVLIVGAGGLGSPAAMYLGAAGVGTLGIVDFDKVDVTNLQRQIIHSTSNVGKNKASSASEYIAGLNPEIQVNVTDVALDENNIYDYIKDYDFVLDCVDNYETKFLINDACVKSNKPFCHGAVQEFNGQAMTFVPGSPCYRCLFEDIPSEEDVVRAKNLGIIGAVAGVIGSVQALEAIKYLTASGDLLTGKMLIFDGLAMKFRTIKFNKNKNCDLH